MEQNNNIAQGNTAGGFGLLRLHIFLDSFGTPAANAQVKITDSYKNVVLEEGVTDANGQIPPVSLPSPPLEYSMNSFMPRPFNEYDVNIVVPDRYAALIRNVQIYPNTTAIQNAIMTPIFDYVDIPYPVLWGTFPPKIPESPIKKLPFPENLVVLPQPVIPGDVVVHDGRPDDAAAPNHTVPYKDYIKNVVSSEIYASWPVEALKANILAIQSFTLNRVFTEWYRGKGFNFTITNSTAYDQAFSYGRNIFREVSDVVDEVFATYITKPDIRQPLLTQYSDGRRVRRDGWLSQWGSKELADQGYTAIQILKNYYGNDVMLMEAEKVEGVPQSFPGVTLKIGSKGDAVRTIQNQLNAISNNYPLIPKLVEDGEYGDATAASVKTFQQIFGLPETGEVDFATWYKISDIYVAVKKLAQNS